MARISDKHLVTTNELFGTRVVGGKGGSRRIGKVRHFVFHPTQKQCIGFTVKRPDFLWMFKRRDAFVPFDGYELVDGRVCVNDGAESTGRAVSKRLGIDWEACVLWLGMPLVAEGGRTLGRVGNVIFSQKTGEVQAIETDSGATANVLLGKREIPVDMIVGFRTGIGDNLATRDSQGSKEEGEDFRGAILVDDEVLALELEDGLAEKAGKTTAIATDKASKAAAAASKSASKAAKKTGEVVNKGAYAAGKQIGKTKGMFAAFKDEYDKARNEDDEDE